jgi:hypothetical protein
MRCMIFALLVAIPILQPARADIWIPPWGEPVYDSTFINITASDEQVLVEVRTATGVVKLISDDYILTWVRDLNDGLMVGDPALMISDSLCDCQLIEGRLEARFLSQLAVEDTLRVDVATAYRYPVDGDGNSLQKLIYNQVYRRICHDPAWGGWEGEVWGPFSEHQLYYSRITSNIDLTVRDWERIDYDWRWGEAHRGRDIVFSHDEDNWWEYDYLAHDIRLDGFEGVADTLSDSLTYEITPEMREMVPDLILEEEVSIQMAVNPHEVMTSYSMLADIRLEPDLARAIAPMWLWFPNDQTEGIETELVGLLTSGAWGEYTESWEEDTLEIRRGRIGEQEGFYIHVPCLEIMAQTPNDQWWWSDPRLRVQVDERWQDGDSCRFILITAPLEPSSVRFTIPHSFGFIRWDSPFEHVRLDDRGGLGHSLTFYGVCREPSVALVVWDDIESAPSDEPVPSEFAIQAIHPNPFNSRTTLTYSLPAPGDVWLEVHDIAGRDIYWQREYSPRAGGQSITLDAGNWAAGVYLLRLEAAGQVRIAKMVCVK